MKNLLFIFGLATAISSETNAIHAEAAENNDRVPFLLVRVQANPSIEIINLPSERTILFDNGRINNRMNLYCEDYNGTPMKAPLVLQCDMEDSVFLRNIATAFGSVLCRYRIGTVSKSTLAQRFNFQITEIDSN